MRREERRLKGISLEGLGGKDRAGKVSQGANRKRGRAGISMALKCQMNETTNSFSTVLPELTSFSAQRIHCALEGSDS